MEPKTIMVGIEHGAEKARDAIALGVMFARAYEAPLVLAGVYPSAIGPGAHGYADVMREPTEAELQTARAFVPDDLDALVRAVGSTSPVRGLHELAEEFETRILVIGPPHVGFAGRAMGNDVALGMLRAAPCAIAIAEPGMAGRHEPLRTIGVAYVPTAEGLEALEEGVDLAHRLGARLRILNVPSSWDRTLDQDRSLSEVMAEQADRDLEEALKIVDGRVPAETVRPEGDPVDELRAATKDLDMLVMGSRAYGPVKRVLVGSVSSHLVHEAACPVLVLPRGARVPIAAG